MLSVYLDLALLILSIILIGLIPFLIIRYVLKAQLLSPNLLVLGFGVTILLFYPIIDEILIGFLDSIKAFVKLIQLLLSQQELIDQQIMTYESKFGFVEFLVLAIMILKTVLGGLIVAHLIKLLRRLFASPGIIGQRIYPQDISAVATIVVALYLGVSALITAPITRKEGVDANTDFAREMKEELVDFHRFNLDNTILKLLENSEIDLDETFTVEQESFPWMEQVKVLIMADYLNDQIRSVMFDGQELQELTADSQSKKEAFLGSIKNYEEKAENVQGSVLGNIDAEKFEWGKVALGRLNLLSNRLNDILVSADKATQVFYEFYRNDQILIDDLIEYAKPLIVGELSGYEPGEHSYDYFGDSIAFHDYEFKYIQKDFELYLRMRRMYQQVSEEIRNDADYLIKEIMPDLKERVIQNMRQADRIAIVNGTKIDYKVNLENFYSDTYIDKSKELVNRANALINMVNRFLIDTATPIPSKKSILRDYAKEEGYRNHLDTLYSVHFCDEPHMKFEPSLFYYKDASVPELTPYE
jgi:hypothetical protein